MAALVCILTVGCGCERTVEGVGVDWGWDCWTEAWGSGTLTEAKAGDAENWLGEVCAVGWDEDVWLDVGANFDWTDAVACKR